MTWVDGICGGGAARIDKSPQPFYTGLGCRIKRQAGRPHSPEGGEAMRITLHIGAFTVTIIVKKRENRHSAK